MQGICHRDLKPENILLCSGKDSKLIIKLSDLGLSKLLHFGTALRTFCGNKVATQCSVLSVVISLGRRSRLKTSFNFIFVLSSGTEQYMAPEVLPCGSGAGEYTLKADCWSLGLLKFLILSNNANFAMGW